MRRWLVGIALFFVAVASFGDSAGWRTYGGGTTSRWKTRDVHHGHDQPPCRPPLVIVWPGMEFWSFPNCNAFDFEHANLDNSIGFRAGRERSLASFSFLEIVGGFEGRTSFTEYNISQVQLAILNGSFTLGPEVNVRGFGLGLRVGGGPFVTTNEHVGLQAFAGGHVTLPLHSGAGLRISHDNMRLSHLLEYEKHELDRERWKGVDYAETSFMIIASDHARSSHWDLSAAVGATRPGVGPLDSLGLRLTAFHRVSIAREVPWPSTQIVINWTASAHESRLPSLFKGYDLNYRSKTINGAGLGLRREAPLSPVWSFTYGVGAEIADWSDEHELLVTEDRLIVNAGIEAALSTSGSIRWHFREGLAAEATVEQLYWFGIALGETRYSMGIVFTH